LAHVLVGEPVSTSPEHALGDQEGTAVTGRTAQEYRRLAQECRTMARSVSTEEARAALLDMAQTWLRLAEEQELAVPPAAVEPAQPAIQQQQQIQPKADDEAE
jgi:hypothetical protein